MRLAGQLTILKSQLEELAISIGEILMPSIRQVVGWIQGLVDWLNGLDEGTKKVIVTVALVAAALGSVLIVVGKVVGAVGTILTVVPKVARAVSGVIGFVSGTVVPALSAVEAFRGMVSGIGSALGSLGRVVQDGFQSAIGFITSLPGRALQWGMDFINGIEEGIRSA